MAWGIFYSMTEATAQDRLHMLYEGDNSTPSATSSDYLTRRGLMNVGINTWEKEALWNELYVNLSDASDGDKTTVNGTSSYDCPTDFRFPVGWLRLGTTYYPFYPPEKFQTIRSTDTATKFYYVTGNANTGYDIHIHPTPSSADTITYEYYKTATELSATTTIFEMSDPYFAIYFALSKLYEQDGLSGESQKAFMEADARLQKMKEINTMTPFYQQNDIPDEMDSRNVSGFGVGRLV